MDAWETMFHSLRSITRSAGIFEEGLKLAFSTARANPLVFDEPDYWAEAERTWSRRSADAVMRWGMQGLERLGPGQWWQSLLLDLGDCPETFDLYSHSSQDEMSEEAIRDLILPRIGNEVSELEDNIVTDVSKTYDLLLGLSRQEYTAHNVEELNDDLLTWNDHEDVDYHGNNGYFLWLMFGTLAFLEPLRDKDYCRHVLAGRDSLYLLSGFEGIYTYLATVTKDGLLIEGDVLPLLLSSSKEQATQLLLPME